MSRLPHESSANDETIDAARGELSDPTPQAVQLVEGSGAHLSTETHSLLRARIRIAAIVLAMGFGVFLIWRFFDPKIHSELLWLHVATTAILTAISFLLCHRCGLCMKTLRVAEGIVFGLPALFFLANGAVDLAAFAHKEKFMPSNLEPWLLLMFVYAQFIPNSWRRAAVVVGLMAIAPIALRIFLFCTDDVCLVANGGGWLTLVPMSLVMGLAAFSATVGVYIIHHLREEAFRAKQLGQYRLKHLIGSGGMGEVYLAEHTLMKRPCAIKLIRPEKAGDPTVLARFEREVRASAKLSHWNSIDIFDYGRAEDGTFYYVMEYLPGMSLQELVVKYGPLCPERMVYLMIPVCEALYEAHSAGIIHRDIKPANIFAAQRGGVCDVAKLLDFGLAKPIATEDEDASLTQTGTVTGSPLFMSPEQATGDSEPDARSDIYALGVVMYFLLTGKPPFEHEKPLKVLIAHATSEPVPVHKLRPDVPEDLELVVMRCLAKRPEKRYQTALELAAALSDCAAAGRWTRDDAASWWQANVSSKEPLEVVEPALA